MEMPEVLNTLIDESHQSIPDDITLLMVSQ
jgi:hypothetical protein